MKRIYIISILITICGLAAMAQNRPDLTHQTGGGDRVIFNIVADKPALTFDQANHEIIVQGNNSDFYAVTASVMESEAIVMQTTIDGEYDVIDVSMLTAGNYLIALTSSHGNTYTWTFNGTSGLNYGSTTLPAQQSFNGITLKDN